MAIRYPKENNPYYPLPSDYPTLDGKGQRQARVNAVTLQETPEDLVHAWAFFRGYYLFPTLHGEWYSHGILPSPPFHYDFIRDLGTYPFNVWAAPRASAKSTILGMEIPLLFLVTRPYSETVVIFSVGRFVNKRFDKVMTQIEHNPRIVADFGILKPTKGSGSWNHSALKLRNGSSLYGLAIEGKMLGERPNLLLFDDVEFDESLVIQPSAWTERFEHLITYVATPMMEMGTCIGIIGTLHNRRFLIHRMATSKDPRYRIWNRRTLTIENPDGSRVWPEKYTDKYLERQREVMGPAAFRSNYFNEPSTEAEHLLRIHPDLCQYTVETSGIGPHDAEQPLNSLASLVSKRKTGIASDSGISKAEEVRRPFGDTVAKMFRIATLDYASTVSRHSDYSCIMVMGFENSQYYKDTLWVLDLFLAKVRDDVLINQLWKMSEKWRTQVIGVEAASIQHQLFERIDLEFGDRVGEQGGWRPRVIPLKYPAGLSKADRICGLQWRFNQFRVILPLDERSNWPIKELYAQIEGFTEDLAYLAHDDAIDTLAMHQYVVRPRRGAARQDLPISSTPRDPKDMIESGDLFYETGIPAITALGAGDLDLNLVHKLRSQREDPDPRKPQPRNWRTIST